MNLDIVLISTAIWVFTAGLWWTFGERRVSSPIFLYLVFHLLSFTIRPWLIYVNHDQSFFHTFVGIFPTAADHTWALWQANFGLLLFVLGGLVGEASARARKRPERWHVVDTQVMTWAGMAILLFGVVSYWLYAPKPWLGRPGRATTEVVRNAAGGYTSITTSTSYLTSFYVTVVGVFITWICFRGMKRMYVPLLGIYFVAVILIGSARTTYLIGAIAVALAIMARQQRRWPSLKVTIVLALFLLSFLAGKGWLNTWITKGREASLTQATNRLDATTSGESDLFINYDMLATVTYVTPKVVPYADFQLYFRPFYFWVPRSLWPSKPVFDYAAAYVAEHAPQIYFQGLTVTLVGESYLAFGLPGVVVMMFLWGLLFSFGHMRSLQFPVASVERVFGIALTVTMIQVFRDGVVSLGQYLLYYFGPCFVIYVASKVLAGQQSTVGEAAAVPAAEAPSALAPLHR